MVEIVLRSPGWPLIPHLARTISNFGSSCLLFSCAGAVGMHYQDYMVLGMEGWTQGFMHAKQALYPLSYIPIPSSQTVKHKTGSDVVWGGR